MEDNYKIVIATSDYTAKSKYEVSFSKGDKLQIIEECDGTEIWLQARNLRNREEGYIPTKHVADEHAVLPYISNKGTSSGKKPKKKNQSNRDKVQEDANASFQHTQDSSLSDSVHPVELKALQDYTAKSIYEVSFKAGDELIPIEDINQMESQVWLQARHLQTKKEGYVPLRYISKKNENKALQVLPNESERTDHLSHNENGSGGSVKPISTSNPDLDDRFIVTALYDYTIVKEGDLAFDKGDELLITKESCGHDNWYFGRNLRTLAEGFIPMNYVKKQRKTENRDSDQEWFYNVDKDEAIALLLRSEQKRGTFLIRNASDQSGKVLLVKDWDAVKKDFRVRKYRIYVSETIGVYIRRDCVFHNLSELVKFYREKVGVLCCLLGEACQSQISHVNLTKFKVPKDSITFGDKKGTGQYHDVFKGEWKNSTLGSKVDVAVKVLKQRTISMDDFLQEAKFMLSMHHPNILKTLAVCIENKECYIVLEWMEKGSLLQYLRENDTYTFNDMISMAAQIASGMMCMERWNCVHRDLGARNILTSVGNVVKVADFFMAREAKVQDPGERCYLASANEKCAVKWTAPDAFRSFRCTSKSDVWSFGILLYEIFTSGRMPYPGMSNIEVLEAVEKGYRMPRPHGKFDVPDSCYNIMLKCWHTSADMRPTFQYLHAFFDDYFVTTETQHRYVT